MKTPEQIRQLTETPHKYRVKKAFGKISQVQRRIFGRWVMWRLFRSSDTGLEWIRKNGY